jgi:uncharacterized membrane protein YebE (DUF533 family)
MLDPKKLLDDLMQARVPGTGSTVAEKAEQAKQLAKDNPLATGALVAVLLGTRAGRQVTGTAVKLGGLAALGGLAYKAWKDYTGGGQPEQASTPAELPAPPQDSGFDMSRGAEGEEEFALTLIRTMIAAARSDGGIDDAERKRILDRLALSGLGADAERFISEELANPAAPEVLAEAAETDAQRVAMYTAARLAVDPDTHEERAFLDTLAAALKLPDPLVAHVETTVEQSRV